MSDVRPPRGVDDDFELKRKDSIEEAVADFLQASRFTRKVMNKDNSRTIAFSEVGDPNGAAIFVCVGMGLTRYITAFFDELAATLRLRLITIDRPGVGASDPYPPSDKSGPLNWPEDVLTVCQYLGIAKFSILAHSAGAIYALATALILPHLVRGKVHLLAPWVPPSQLEAISHTATSAPPANPLPRSQRFLRVLPTPFLKAANSSFMTATSASIKPATKRTMKSNSNKSSPSSRKHQQVDENTRGDSLNQERPEYHRRESMMLMDQLMPVGNPMDMSPIEDTLRRGSLTLSATATPMDPGYDYATSGLQSAEHAEKERQGEYTSRLTQATWDLATRDSNPATDLVVCLERNRDVGFRYTDVGREVVITHGAEDRRVPVANVRWLAEQMNRRAENAKEGNRCQSRDSELSSSTNGRCEVRVLEGEGHGLMASPLIMGDILTEIAEYWRGQDQ
jgi:pimeloyl-ACP methyl ester carboxylesterase